MNKHSLSKLLTKYVPKNISVLDRCKIIYRPYITPFVEILSIIPHRSRIFDIGCGNGALLNLIYQTKSPIKIGGIEISKKLVDNANELLHKTLNNNSENYIEINIKQYDGISLPNLIGYDVVLLVDVLHHIPKIQLMDFLLSLKQNMKSGSILILKDIDAGKALLVLFNKLHDLIVSQEIGNEISKKRAENFLLQAGFKIKLTTYQRMLWYPHYTILAIA